MTLKKQILAGALLVAAAFFGTTSSFAEGLPQWAKKEVTALNKQRSNNTYHFVKVTTEGNDLNALQAQRVQPLVEELAKTYTLSAQDVQIDTIAYKGGTKENMAYRITFAGNNPAVFVAKSVDEYTDLGFAFDEASNDHKFYQLFAVSEKNAMPDFDDLKVTNYYPKSVAWRSLVPGLGQMHKGQTVRGAAILGSEVLLLASAVVFEARANHFTDKGREVAPGELRNAWASKTAGWREMRNMSLYLAGGIYVANLIDAAFSPGRRHVKLTPSAKQATKMAFVPMITTEGSGLSFVLNF